VCVFVLVLVFAVCVYVCVCMCVCVCVRSRVFSSTVHICLRLYNCMSEDVFVCVLVWGEGRVGGWWPQFVAAEVSL